MASSQVSAVVTNVASTRRRESSQVDDNMRIITPWTIICSVVLASGFVGRVSVSDEGDRAFSSSLSLEFLTRNVTGGRPSSSLSRRLSKAGETARLRRAKAAKSPKSKAAKKCIPNRNSLNDSIKPPGGNCELCCDVLDDSNCAPLDLDLQGCPTYGVCFCDSY